jgi:hypothetical protein
VNARESQSQQSRQPGWKIVQDDKGNRHHGRDGWSASLADQVDPSQYFTDIEGLVMRSVQTGRDLGQLTKDLQEQFGVTAPASGLCCPRPKQRGNRVNDTHAPDELGITQAIWVHSGAAKHPRPTHVAMNGTKYDVNRACGTRP